MTRQNKIKRTNEDRAYSIIIGLIMLIVVFVTAYPFWYSVVLAFNKGSDALRGGLFLWPRAFTLENFQAVLGIDYVPTAFVVSLSRTVLGTFLAVLFTGVFAYAMAHQRLMFRKFYMGVMIVAMYFSGGFIPQYMLIRSLKLIDSFWVYIIPNLFSTFNAIIMINFFREIPESLEESAKIDGANDFYIFIKIIIPLSMPLIATMALYSGVWHWNTWTDAAFYITKKSLKTLSYVLIDLINQTEAAASTVFGTINQQEAGYNAMTLRPAAMIICVIPIVVVYPFLQKYFVKGIMLGSVKG